MNRLMFASILLFATIILVSAQRKPGDCPPAGDVGVCAITCQRDAQCRGDTKCCRTACGGSVCVRAVTPRPQNPGGKPGFCPQRPSGPWVCSSRCSVDADCRGGHKCCKNRCGALACIKPEGI